MIDADKILSGVFDGYVGGKRKKKKKKGGLLNSRNMLIGLGAAGLAFAAHEHFSNKKNAAPQTGATPPQIPPQATSGTQGWTPPPPPTRSSREAAAVPPPPPAALPPASSQQPQTGGQSVLLLRAMIAAAHADHVVDAAERRAIVGKAVTLGLTAEEREFLEHEMDRPRPVHEIADEAKALGAARLVYAVTLAAIDVDTEAERAYLQRLAAVLGLSDAEIAELHETFGVPA